MARRWVVAIVLIHASAPDPGHPPVRRVASRGRP